MRAPARANADDDSAPRRSCGRRRLHPGNRSSSRSVAAPGVDGPGRRASRAANAKSNPWLAPAQTAIRCSQADRIRRSECGPRVPPPGRPRQGTASAQTRRARLWPKDAAGTVEERREGAATGRGARRTIVRDPGRGGCHQDRGRTQGGNGARAGPSEAASEPP